METHILFAYLEANPLVALLLVALLVLWLGSLIRKLLKWTIILTAILLVFLYLTNEKAEANWQLRLSTAQDRALELGRGALEKGKEVWDEHGLEALKKGRQAISIRLETED